MMSPRQLFNNILHYKAPDRVPLWQVEDVMELAVRKWCREGDYPMHVSGAEAFPFDGEKITVNFGDQPPIPAFVKKTLSLDDEYRVVQDEFGFKVRQKRGESVSPRHYIYLEGSIDSRKDWEAMKARFNPSDVRRLPLDWGPEYFEHLNNSSQPVIPAMNWGPARGIKNGYMLGFDRYMEVLMEDPGLLQDIFSFWADFIISFLSPLLENVTVDAFVFKEDGMGYKTSTLISPAQFDAIYKPSMLKVTEFLRSHGVDVICYYSSGNLIPLIPSLLEAGVNMTMPVECAAGMDALDLRKRFGKDLLLMGNISRQAIMDGREAIEQEVMGKVPRLMEEGGYIPAFDDAIMEDMRYEDVLYCAELIKSIQI